MTDLLHDEDSDLTVLVLFGIRLELAELGGKGPKSDAF